jgi:hypothetical protein
MATRARIGIENADGSIFSSYHHWDGYPAGLGFNLISHWDNPETLREAISLGDASNWGKRIAPVGEHSFAAPEENVNVYYGRDRGEDNVGPVTFDSMDQFIEEYNCAGEEYAYVLHLDGTWTMIDRYGERVTHDAEDDIILARADMIKYQRNHMKGAA